MDVNDQVIVAFKDTVTCLIIRHGIFNNMPFIPQDFVNKWKWAEGRGRPSGQEHFIDQCTLIGYHFWNGEILNELLLLNMERAGVVGCRQRTNV